MRVLLGLVACCLSLLAGVPAAGAHHTPVPGTVALVGSLQSELGCPGDWQPECPQTRLAPVAGSPGVFRGTFDVPAGGYRYKVALNGTWDENYGAGGAAGGADIPLTAPGGAVTFTYDHATHIIGDDTPKALQSERGAHWLRTGVIAWQPPAGAQEFRLHHAPEGGLRVADGAIAGASIPLGLDPAGLPADVRAAFPHLAGHAALELPPARAGSPAPCSRASWWSPPTTAPARCSAPRASRSPASSTTSTRAPVTPRSGRSGTAGARRSRCGRRRPSRSCCCSTRRGPDPSGASRCAAATTACGARRATRPGAARPTATRSGSTSRRSTPSSRTRSPTPTRSR